jgi:hypothetical protein
MFALKGVSMWNSFFDPFWWIRIATRGREEDLIDD